MLNTLTPEQIQEKWGKIVNHEDLPEIHDSYIKRVTARLLQNQEDAINEGMLHEAPTNVIGDDGANPNIATFKPILISMVRRAVPKLIAYDMFGVQPMTGPTGLIFAIRSRYDGPAGDEALHHEADSKFSGDGTVDQGDDNLGSGDSTLTDPLDALYGYGAGMATSKAEDLGDGENWAEMGFSIEKSSVEAKSRGLKASYSVELAQDLKAIHGLDAESELANILSTEIIVEQNRETVRRIYTIAELGAQDDVVTPGVFDLDTDSNGRWSVERFKGLMFQSERDANRIAYNTKRGKGNFMITSADVASALAMTGLLDTGSGKYKYLPGVVDTTGTTFVGVLNGVTKVFVDPYITTNVICMGYKGANAYDAGAFFCPYVPLTLYKAIAQESFQPRLGFKTRYGMVANPFAAVSSAGGLTGLSKRNNPYFRIFRVDNLV